ncbi:hypothetical protein [Thiomonas sp.]
MTSSIGSTQDLDQDLCAQKKEISARISELAGQRKTLLRMTTALWLSGLMIANPGFQILCITAVRDGLGWNVAVAVTADPQDVYYGDMDLGWDGDMPVPECPLAGANLDAVDLADQLREIWQDNDLGALMSSLYLKGDPARISWCVARADIVALPFPPTRESLADLFARIHQ